MKFRIKYLFVPAALLTLSISFAISSCSTNNTKSSNKDIVANDNKTVIKVQDNSYQLQNKFSENEIQKLKYIIKNQGQALNDFGILFISYSSTNE